MTHRVPIIPCSSFLFLLLLSLFFICPTLSTNKCLSVHDSLYSCSCIKVRVCDGFIVVKKRLIEHIFTIYIIPCGSSRARSPFFVISSFLFLFAWVASLFYTYSQSLVQHCEMMNFDWGYP